LSTARWIQNGGDLFTIPARCPTCRKLLRASGLEQQHNQTFYNISQQTSLTTVTTLY